MSPGDTLRISWAGARPGTPHPSTPHPHADTHDVLEEVHYGVFVLGPAVLRLLGQGAIVGGSGCVVSILRDRGRRLEGQRRSSRGPPASHRDSEPQPRERLLHPQLGARFRRTLLALKVLLSASLECASREFGVFTGLSVAAGLALLSGLSLASLALVTGACSHTRHHQCP